jgi:predicted nucleic acid-binding protein
VQGQQLVTSRVAVIEVAKAVARANPVADPQPIFALLGFVELDADLAWIAAATGGAGLRVLNAIHIASALRLGPELESFVTYDARQASAARSAGLEVLTPATRAVSDDTGT